MQDVTDFRGLIALFPSARAFGREVAGASNQELGRVWKRRNRVPRDLHEKVVAAAAARGLAVDMDFLARLYQAGHKQGR